jgi:hypothetical protein
MEWIYTRTKVSGHGSLELAQENRKKELQNFTFLKTASSDIHDCFHGCVGA